LEIAIHVSCFAAREVADIADRCDVPPAAKQATVVGGTQCYHETA